MSLPFAAQKSYSIGGKDFTEKKNVSVGLSQVREETLAAAKPGTLTVRTDANTGSLTMAAGHGFTTGNKIDLYWAGGSRRNVTVGTVATNVVPIDLGSGDDLPVATTPITAMKPISFPYEVDGDEVQGIAFYADVPATIVLVDNSNAELYAKVFVLAQAADGWYQGQPEANPVAGAAIAAVLFSHSDATKTRTLRVGAGIT